MTGIVGTEAQHNKYAASKKIYITKCSQVSATHFSKKERNYIKELSLSLLLKKTTSYFEQECPWLGVKQGKINCIVQTWSTNDLYTC